MHEKRHRCEPMIFNYETTYRTDYRDGEITNVIRTVFVPKPVKPRPAPIPLNDIQALYPLRNPKIPVNLFHRPMPIIRTSPCVMQEVHLRPVDEMRLEVQQTRPEVLMTPALRLDTVEEPMRQKFMDHIYKSTQMKALDESVALSGKRVDVKAPLTGKYTPAKMVGIEPLNPPYVSPEWRMQTTTWDNDQLRAHTEPTKRFWLGISPTCSDCKEFQAKALKRIKRR